MSAKLSVFCSKQFNYDITSVVYRGGGVGSGGDDDDDDDDNDIKISRMKYQETD